MEVSATAALRRRGREVGSHVANLLSGRDAQSAGVRRVTPIRPMLGLVIASVLWAFPALTPVSAAPADPNQAARAWFQDAKFGMFIHWGVYSVPARGEWVMEHEHIPVSEYEKFAPQFNPTQFSAQAIVALAKRAGMRYISITSKPHDGFAMWPTRQSRWDSLDASPYRQDPLKTLATEAQRQGIKLFFY